MPLFFSYSGLKTQTLVTLERICREANMPMPGELAEGEELRSEIIDLLASFRKAAVRQILSRVDRLHAEEPMRLLAVSGGVAANRLLRREITSWAEAAGVELRLVPLVYCGDNAAMIAHAALIRHHRGESDDPLSVEAQSRIPI